mmetsp:Transcript_21203/g.50361  ORF Transcript_21203/g.50361 Transcript_21203/m.50361 type:complete len:245 (+) Transcript_21203:1442-2176(+)
MIERKPTRSTAKLRISHKPRTETKKAKRWLLSLTKSNTMAREGMTMTIFQILLNLKRKLLFPWNKPILTMKTRIISFRKKQSAEMDTNPRVMMMLFHMNSKPARTVIVRMNSSNVTAKEAVIYLMNRNPTGKLFFRMRRSNVKGMRTNAMKIMQMQTISSFDRSLAPRTMQNPRKVTEKETSTLFPRPSPATGKMTKSLFFPTSNRKETKTKRLPRRNRGTSPKSNKATAPNASTAMTFSNPSM